MMTLSEHLGLVGGYAFGAVFGLGSFLRRSRIFHSHGYIFRGECQSEILGGPVVVRFSSALWKHKVWPDVLGLAFRFGDEDNFQDLLFVTTNHVWKLPLNMLTSHHKDFLKNTFYSITPFEVRGKILKFRAYCQFRSGAATRSEKLRDVVYRGEGLLIIESNDGNGWTPFAKIKMEREINIDQEELKFSPFNQGKAIRPVGLVNYLRLRSYQMSQLGRKIAHTNFKVLHESRDV